MNSNFPYININFLFRFVLLHIKAIFNSGKKYCCPLCNQWFNDFLAAGSNAEVILRMEVIGSGYRKHLCPYCFSKDRDRASFLYIKNVVNQRKSPYFLLHIAPEPQLGKQLMEHPLVKYVSGDAYLANYTKKDFSEETLHLNVLNLPFDTDSFNIIICNHVLEHIEDDDKAIREIFRVLAKNGFAILQVPYSLINSNTYQVQNANTKAKRILLYGQFDHVRIYSKNDYIQKLEKAGFFVEQVNWEKVIGARQVNRLGLNPQEVLIVCHKLKTRRFENEA